VLLLHGFPTWSYDYAEVASDLARDHDVITLDFLACGAARRCRADLCSTSWRATAPLSRAIKRPCAVDRSISPEGGPALVAAELDAVLALARDAQFLPDRHAQIDSGGDGGGGHGVRSVFRHADNIIDSRLFTEDGTIVSFLTAPELRKTTPRNCF
jgi:pimeloyl-ACP methyl ester carboxylesterase